MLNACVIGLGNRGTHLTKYILAPNPDVKIVALCDFYEDRAHRLDDMFPDARVFTNYKEALNTAGIDVAYVFTGWDTHAEISLYAMKKGIAVASEVGSEYSLENCFELVRTQETTGTPYMLMENCCWGKDELLATSIARKGLFGTIVHCQGAYAHDLRDEVAYGHVNRHYRFDNYKYRCLDNYPTHDFGPIAKLLDINRGNRVLSVSSFASKAAGLAEYIACREDSTEDMCNTVFKQGDIVTTVITCANGETVLLRLDTTLPRSYSREFTIRGTKGSYYQDTNSIFLDGDTEEWSMPSHIKHTINNAENYEAEYMPKIWKEVTPEALSAGHGGMDYFAYKAFTDAIINKAPMPVDVYDSAVWQAIGVLSEKSIAAGGAPQAMPDFTHGQWITRKRLDVCEI